MLRYDAKAKFYRVISPQPIADADKELITDADKAQRRKFCEWFLGQEVDFVLFHIFTDEIFFVLHPKPHCKNEGKWSKTNPHEFVETNDRNDKKNHDFCSKPSTDLQFPSFVHTYLASPFIW